MNHARVVMAAIICVSLPALLLLHLPALAQGPLRITVQTVKATKGPKSVDPQLRSIARELSSILNYSSFSLIKRSNLNLAVNQSGKVGLPKGQVLELTPLGIDGKRARLSVSIKDGGRETFHTILQLVNRGSVLIGGPSYEDGALMFNVSAQF